MHSMGGGGGWGGGIIKRILKSLSQISCDDVVKSIILMVAKRLKLKMMIKIMIIIAITVTNINIYATFNVSR